MVGSRGLFICAAHRSRAELDGLLRDLAHGNRTCGRILFRTGDDEWCILDLMTTPKAPCRVFATAQPVKPLDVAKITALGAVFGLTRAETAVLLQLTAGATPKDIGRKLDMSIHTVRAHLRSICMRMGVKGINGALRLSFQMS
ncbi:helix-turn-helix transcriptional regulator [Brevundimonas guildfordensis]|uniref:Helix-turn-helix transcriptional regulator n=1 Tax=Brevundimonas guildfordensis TaxID=2762241 RepID=A0ABR8QXT7_9CAUL|nr:helix-turn-helix transcriptional regulator [Brevundimonas guildfordensis]MBD7940057.1 helix-turn-helix transcriptional regulator [Brevundimonas guildfordensis]